jgi:hypothetical protein
MSALSLPRRGRGRQSAAAVVLDGERKVTQPTKNGLPAGFPANAAQSLAEGAGPP